MSVPIRWIIVLIGFSQMISVTYTHTTKMDGQHCESPVFCHGDFLHAIQLSGILKDGKEFVDRPLRVAPDVVLREYNNLAEKYGKNRIPGEKLKHLVEDYFSPVGHDLEEWTPDDWRDPKEPGASVPLLARIKDRSMKSWAEELHGKWREFGRKAASSVRDHPDRHSLIDLPHPFISPGEVSGRFREQHYWESYWIIHGLFISGMNQTAKGMILNFASLVDRFGYVPIGNRVYYQNRPQAPMLASMVKLYWLHSISDAEDLIKQTLPAIEKEYTFWMTFRAVDLSVNGRKFTLNRYKGSVIKPRPESYREDLETARSLRNRSGQGVEDKFFANIAAASESAWEFSTRWLDSTHKLTDIRTEDVIPVDLNAIMCLTEQHLSTFYKIVGDDTKSTEFMTKSIQRGDAIHAVFWSEPLSMWRDFDLTHNRKRQHFYLSHITPLFATCSSSQQDIMDTDFLRKVLNSKDIQRALSYPGGMPVSFLEPRDACSSCQFDSPNTWPPLQVMLIEALSRNTDLSADAAKIAQHLVKVVHGGYMDLGYMFEKYNVNKSGHYGIGGEYVVQPGYAPTNGAILRLLELYPSLLPDPSDNEVFDHEPIRNEPKGPNEHPAAHPDSQSLASSDQPALDAVRFSFPAQMQPGTTEKADQPEYSAQKIPEEPAPTKNSVEKTQPMKLSRAVAPSLGHCQRSASFSVSILLIFVIMCVFGNKI